MKILQLCNKPPYPAVDGGTIAMNSITQGLLAKGCTVKVLTVETDKHPLRREALPPDYVQQTGIEAVAVDLNVKPLPAAGALLCGESYNVKRYVSNDFARKLREVLQEEEYDVVHVESIYLTPYVPLIRKHSKAFVALRAHNVEHEVWQRVAQSMKHGLRRWYVKHLALALRAYEAEHLNDYDAILSITQNDADGFRALGCRKPIMVLPFGVEAEGVDHVEEEPGSLFHIGAMDWMSNQESIAWFLDKVWPVVHSEVPQAHLYLAGRKMPQRWMEMQMDGVTVVGEVADAMYFIGSKQINVVPLRSGSGIRVKIIEAMSVGKTVISTTIGAQGIECTDGVDILIADTPEEFARQVRRCIEEPGYCRAIGSAAAQLIAEKYNMDTLAERLVQFYKSTIEG